MSGTWNTFGAFSVEICLDDEGCEQVTVYHTESEGKASLDYVEDNHAVIDDPEPNSPYPHEYNIIAVPHDIVPQIVAWVARETGRTREEVSTLEIDVQFGPCDRLNPRFGYYLNITRSSDGARLLRTNQNPVTGKRLLSPIDCCEVLSWYYRQPGAGKSFFVTRGAS